MQIIDNIHQKLNDDLKNTIKKDSKVSIAAAYFSIYAYQELKKQLEQVDELRFLFTSPSFTSDKTKKEKREFYIPRLNREKSLYGTEFEVKLRNELTQKAIAKECVDWIKKKAQFKSNVTQEHISGFMNVNSSDDYTYAPLNGFTTIDLGVEKGNHMHGLVNRVEGENALYYKRTFDQIWNDKEKLQDVTDEVIDNITTVYKENAPEFIYFLTLYNIFNEFLDDLSEDVLPDEATGFKESAIWNKLYDFQKEACLAMINKLEKYNGCILADSVGLGKTFTALSVIKYYENRNKTVLVLCPKKLSDNWNTYKQNLLNNPIADDRLRYDVLYHTDLSRDKGYSNGIPLDRINWGNYDLVVIDESHNFRNGGQVYGENDEKENRYLKLLNRVIRQGVKTKVLMLSATPVNNRFTDLKNQLALAYEGEEDKLNRKLNTKTTIDTIFRRAQAVFNTWSESPAEKRTTDQLLRMLDFDFFELLDSVTIARSRKHIEQYYDKVEVGTFPERRTPISIRCNLSNIENLMDYNTIYEHLSMLNLGIYKPTEYILPSKISKYEEIYGTDMAHTRFKQSDREQGILVLMRTNLLKRLESSVYSFRLTMERMLTNINNTIQTINDYREGKSVEINNINRDDFDIDDQNTDFFSVGSKVKIILNDMDYQSWLDDLNDDKEILIKLIDEMKRVSPQNDEKLFQLIKTIEHKINNPINEQNKKVIIFSAFSDTVEYLYKHVSTYFRDKYGLNSAMVTGGDGGANTVKGLSNDLNTILTCFSPKSKDKELILPNQTEGIDILIATDVISEGQNLQDCDYLINYDIHWNPVRIIQRFGRIDRIGSTNKEIQLVNFWPDMDLDDYINLKARVETRMKITVMTSTGDDNPIDDESGDLEYRKQQLERLQKEVVDIEEMTSGVSIMDLGLNEFRMDLLGYIKEKPSLEEAPMGMHAIVPSSDEHPPGVVYILKNINNDINAKSQNRLYPFYLVYISEEGEVIHNHLDPKTILDLLRLKSRGFTEPIMNLCRSFNEETSDGRNMEKYSDLLQDTISSIINVNEESDIDSLFKAGGTTALRTHVKGLDDFELVSFMVVR
ncbi:RNA polymerase-associated protein RapA [Jeotgalicoccus saudimassiliensis]|uniref:RNA polymerase-associated protein RapA n=1 Tax=Jeotgalicoccus saudimassiliensis TaxID=1461582 RepID=A0A078MBQ9_9STAP|nr:helicase-related protein [Jeotgalicoccus saudimassiliensis]CEA02882.1 RNA polymerase-associated protein RapA [Jeotgalicoccus saudimassiliensis]